MSLPPEFAELLPFEDKWALRSEAERQGARLASDIEDIRAFYTAMQARVDDILTLLADHDPADLSEELKPLFLPDPVVLRSRACRRVVQTARRGGRVRAAPPRPRRDPQHDPAGCVSRPLPQREGQ